MSFGLLKKSSIKENMNPLSKLSNWYFTRSALPYWCILIMDYLIVFFTTIFVYTLFYGISHVVFNFVPLLGMSAFYGLFYIIGFRAFGTYSGVIRYSSFVDIQRIIYAVIVGFLFILISRFVMANIGHDLNDIFLAVSYKLLLVVAFISALIMGMSRITIKSFYDQFFNNADAKRTFIYGVKAGGVSLAKSIRSQKPSQFSLCGFISSQNDVTGKMLMGVKVYPLSHDLVQVMLDRNISALLVSPLKSDEFRENTEFQEQLIKAGIHAYMLPAMQEWKEDSEISHTQLHEVEIEDLLPREKIEVDMDAVGALLKDRTILITGAAGSIGGEMVKQIAIYNPKKLILVDQAETPMHDVRMMMARLYGNIEAHTIVTSICKEKRMDEIFRDFRPDYVFHAAAYKHVPMMEDNPSEAVQNNIYGTKIIADCAVKYGVKKFVMISTDKAVNPTNVMGCSKRICEIYVQSLDKAIKDGKVKGITQFVTTRFGNVLGSNGSVIPIFKNQIKRGGPVTVTDPNIIRFFMLIPEACKLVLEAGTMGNGGEIFVFDMGKPVKIADLAQRMIDLSGAKNVEIKYTGLRDGEKLYEEVLNDEELTKPTFHPKIKIATVRDEEYASVDVAIETLQKSSFTFDDMKVVKMMKEIVPEFISKHSKYETLDK